MQMTPFHIVLVPLFKRLPQSAFDVCQLSLIKYKLVLNPEKTKCMLFSRSHCTDDSTGIHTLQSTQIEIVDSCKYSGIWLDSRLSFQTHVKHISKKLKEKTGLLFRNQSCFSFSGRKIIVQSTIMSVFDYGDVLFMHAVANILNPLDAVFHNALYFIAGDGFLTHHCVLCEKVDWPSLAIYREQHYLLFIYKALSGNLPPYLSLLLNFNRLRLHFCSQSHIRLDTSRVNTEAGRKPSVFMPLISGTGYRTLLS